MFGFAVIDTSYLQQLMDLMQNGPYMPSWLGGYFIVKKRINNGSKNIDDYFTLGKIYLENCQYDELLRLYNQIDIVEAKESQTIWEVKKNRQFCVRNFLIQKY